jgi:hypothetical protein
MTWALIDVLITGAIAMLVLQARRINRGGI